LVQSDATVIVPFDERVIVVRLLNCAEFSRRPTEGSQTLDAISGNQLLDVGRGFGKRRFPGAVRVGSRTTV
jgi:hypothetical protein